MELNILEQNGHIENTNTMASTTERVTTLWDTMTSAQQDDLKFLRDQTNHHETELQIETDANRRKILEASYQLIDKRCSSLKKELSRQLKEKEKAVVKLESEAKESSEQSFCKDFLATHQIYFVATEYQYLEYFPDTGKWENMLPQSLHKLYGFKSGTQVSAFESAMHEMGRNKVSIECSFYPKPNRVLNLMRRDHWAKPLEGAPHYAFTLLMKSLGNNNTENMDHIEQLVYWKYTHPEEYKLACLVIYGEGGVGKNLFVSDVLGTIFGKHQVLVADVEKTLGQFNGLIQGKTVVMIDEAVADKINVERLKRTVGNRTIDVNPKYGKQGEHDNTPWYLAGGNDSSGAVLLSGDATDRRWSIIKVEKSIIQRLMDDKTCAKEEAVDLFQKINYVYTDPVEVSKWLDYLVKRWSHLEVPPVGLHQADYRELLETQKSPFDELMEIVFGNENFEYIEGLVLYELLQAYTKATNPAARGVMSRNKFYGKVRDRNARQGNGIAWGQLKVCRCNKITTAWAFHKPTGRTVFQDNRHVYLSIPDHWESNQNPYWVIINQEEIRVVGRLNPVEEDIERLKAEENKTNLLIGNLSSKGRDI